MTSHFFMETSNVSTCMPLCCHICWLLYLASINLWGKDPITAITIGIIVWQNHGLSLFLTKNSCGQDFLMSLVRGLIGINISLRQKPNCCMPQFVCKLLFTNYSAIIEHTNQVIFLEDDDVAAVTNGSLTIHRIRRNFDDPNESTVREVISLQMEIQQIMKGTKMILSLLCYNLSCGHPGIAFSAELFLLHISDRKIERNDD